jgi:hypothetical protein
MSEGAAAEAQNQHGENGHGKSVDVTVVNEDNGKEYELHGGHGEQLANLVKQLYDAKLKSERQPDDRLRCESSGEDVFPFANQGMTVGAYFDAGHCPDHTWLFAAGTGGA